MERKRIIVACDSFKGSLSSLQAGLSAKAGIESVIPDAEVEIVRIADGGEGTVEAILSGCEGESVECNVEGPLGDPVKALYALCGDTAVIEMAQASGLTLLPERLRDPLLTGTRGTGMLIADALRRGCRRILVGLGGSATNDGGVGMLQALGYVFTDSAGCPVGRGGAELARIASIDARCVNPLLKEAEIRVACDVTNPLTGPDGASRVFAPQKGADPRAVSVLEDAMKNYARVASRFCGCDFSDEPGAGAAGGLAFAFRAFLGARLLRGVDMVLDAVDFRRKLRGASLVITGEGRIDSQTCMGKAPYGVLLRAREMGIPVVAIGGSVAPGAETRLLEAGFRAVIPVSDPTLSLSESMRPDVASRSVAQSVARFLKDF